MRWKVREQMVWERVSLLVARVDVWVAEVPVAEGAVSAVSTV